MSCEQARLSLGAYVLGALEAPERDEVARHLSQCPRCRADLVELEGLPLLLDRIPVSDVVSEVQLAELELPVRQTRALTTSQPVEQPSPRLLGRLLNETADRLHPVVAHAGPPLRPWWRHRLLATAAAVVVLAATVTGAVGGLASSSQARPSEGTVTEAITTTDVRSKVTATAWLTSTTAGTAIRLRIAGAAPGERCWLVAVDRSGRQQTVASWQVTYQGDATVAGDTSINREDLTALNVLQGSNHTLASLPIS